MNTTPEADYGIQTATSCLSRLKHRTIPSSRIRSIGSAIVDTLTPFSREHGETDERTAHTSSMLMVMCSNTFIVTSVQGYFPSSSIPLKGTTLSSTKAFSKKQDISRSNDCALGSEKGNIWMLSGFSTSLLNPTIDLLLTRLAGQIRMAARSLLKILVTLKWTQVGIWNSRCIQCCKK